jgi:superfamily II DNA or RNA helicase
VEQDINERACFGQEAGSQIRSALAATTTAELKGTAPENQAAISTALRPLRPHQERALEALRRSLLAGHRRVMLQAPTGFGKTLTAAHIIRRALDKQNRVIFTVPALNLVDQTVASFAAEGIDCVGIMQGDHPGTDSEQPVQVCSVQTLARRQKPDAAVVVVDEAHLAFASVHEWMADPDWARVHSLA